jgi:hypothetical protein
MSNMEEMYDLKAAVRGLLARMRPTTGWIRTALRSAAPPPAGTSASQALTASDERLEGNIGDHLDISSPVSAVVGLFTSSDLLLSGGRNALETQVAPPPAAALLGLDRIDDQPERRNPKPGPPWRINTACQGSRPMSR